MSRRPHPSALPGTTTIPGSVLTAAVLLAALAVLSAVSPALSASVVTAAPLKLQRETDHFRIYSADVDLPVLDRVAAALEGSCARISTHLGQAPQDRIRVEIYPDRKTYWKASGVRTPPSWMVGNSGPGFVKLVSPANPGWSRDFEGMLKVAVHEFTHAAWPNTGQWPKWFREGLAAYEAGQMDAERQKFIARAASAGSVPSLRDLEADSVTFGNRGGYAFSYTIVEFMAERHGWEKVRAFVRRPEIEPAFGVSAEALWAEWVEFLLENYAPLRAR